MPINKKESFVYTIIMCGFMVFVMSFYNVSRHMGVSLESLKVTWLGFPLAFIVAFICDFFIVSRPAKTLAFKIVGFEAPTWKKVIAVSTCMITGMVVLMSFYGAVMAVGFSDKTLLAWLINIPLNFVLALPLQLLVAGPLVRFSFRKVFPVGTICCPE